MADIEEGLNAGMWTVAVAVTGNEMGLRESEIVSMDSGAYRSRREHAYRRLAQAGPHFLVDGIADADKLIDRINAWLARGERP